MFDMKGIAVLSGFVCILGFLDFLYVLLVIGFEYEVVYGFLRIIFGEDNIEEDIDYFLEVLFEIVLRLREMSLFYESVKKGGKWYV